MFCPYRSSPKGLDDIRVGGNNNAVEVPKWGGSGEDEGEQWDRKVVEDERVRGVKRGEVGSEGRGG